MHTHPSSGRERLYLALVPVAMALAAAGLLAIIVDWLLPVVRAIP